MKQSLVYDLPTRLFHWIFAVLFLTGFVIAETSDDDSALFPYHMLAGLLLGFVVLLRIVWGVVGTKYARFWNFSLNPVDLMNYFKGILSGDKRRWVGHNPASSWAAIAMMLMALGLAVTGYLMTSGPNEDTFEDLHELLSNGFLVVAILHVAGVALHTLRHQEMIGLSMVHGKKQEVSDEQSIPSPRAGMGIVFIGLLVVFSTYLFKNFDSQTQKLQFFGSSLQLGENEGSESGGREGNEDKEESEDRDDD